MTLHLQRENWYVIAALVVISVISGFLMDFIQGSTLIAVHDASFYLPGPALLIGSVFIYLARDKYGGTVARNLEVIGASLAILGVSWIGFSAFFAAGFPVWGVSSGFWVTLLGGLITTSFFLAAYGFYMFWKLEEERGGGSE
jgi:hypothetical protein